jgi:hypothetical protein
VMFGGLLVVLCCLLVMLSCFFVMFVSCMSHLCAILVVSYQLVATSPVCRFYNDRATSGRLQSAYAIWLIYSVVAGAE